MQEYNLGFNLLCYEAVFFGICVQNSCAVLQRADSLLLFSAMLYECVTQECPEMMPTYIAIEQVIQKHALPANRLPDCNLEKRTKSLKVCSTQNPFLCLSGSSGCEPGWPAADLPLVADASGCWAVEQQSDAQPSQPPWRPAHLRVSACHEEHGGRCIRHLAQRCRRWVQLSLCPHLDIF